MGRSRVVLAGLGVAVVGVVAFAAPAAAHVVVDSGQPAQQGGSTRVVFRVPNESDSASTAKVEVTLPEEQPLSSVRTKPVPGWTAETVTTKLATPLQSHGRTITEVISKITWTATGPDSQIKPGQYQEFPVSLGGLPKADQMVFKAVQSYSDGNIVRWIEEKEGANEPEHPAPTLKLVAGDAAAGAVADSSHAEADSGHSVEDKLSESAPILAIVGAVAGLAGLALGAVAFARTRKAPSA